MTLDSSLSSISDTPIHFYGTDKIRAWRVLYRVTYKLTVAISTSCEWTIRLEENGTALIERHAPEDHIIRMHYSAVMGSHKLTRVI